MAAARTADTFFRAESRALFFSSISRYVSRSLAF